MTLKSQAIRINFLNKRWRFELPSLQWAVEVHQGGKEEERWAVFSLNELKKKVQESKVVDAVNFWDFSKLETYGNNQDRIELWI